MNNQYLSRREQFEFVKRLALSYGVGLSKRLCTGEELPLFSDVVATLKDEYHAEYRGCSLLSDVEVEALAFRCFLTRPVPGFGKLSRYYTA